jgi:hypothetical protein
MLQRNSTTSGYRAKPPRERLREVYTDESYIHEHYHWNKESLFDPEDDKDVIYQKEKHKGRCYCFCAAIQGPDPPSCSGSASGARGQGWTRSWAYLGLLLSQKKGDNQGDYHKVFSGDNYITWFRVQLLANLHQPSLIMLDNAAYHCVHGEQVPKWH